MKHNSEISEDVVFDRSTKTFFAPELYIRNGVHDISFYAKAFNALELRRWSNDDGTIHVAELSIDGAIFHLHEEASRPSLRSPETLKASSVLIGLFVDDVHSMMDRAIAAGATLISAVKDYDYGYRQGVVQDPFGHQWMIEMRIA